MFGNLVINNKPCGIQLFIVPLRHPVSGEPLPGVTVGDIGPKFGRDGNDNGYISFDKVRIPRANMLAKWSQVERNGTFRAPPNPAIAYFSTILERVGSVGGAASFAAHGLTIATRFAAVRRQGSNKTPEPQIIDYPVHQTRYLLLYLDANFPDWFPTLLDSMRRTSPLVNCLEGTSYSYNPSEVVPSPRNWCLPWQTSII